MKINIYHLLEGAKKAEGLTVVIDVFRAFSLVCYAFQNGASRIIPIADIEQAYELKKKNPSFVLMGERNEQKPLDFDYGNSPSHILNTDFTGKTIIHTTSAGTQGLVNAINASERITGSFVNAPAIIKYIADKNPDEVSLVCMGYSMKHPTEEDSFCAEYIKANLERSSYDIVNAFNIIRNTSGKRFFEEKNQEFSPKTDFELCLALGKFDFIVKATENNDYLQLTKSITSGDKSILSPFH